MHGSDAYTIEELIDRVSFIVVYLLDTQTLSLTYLGTTPDPSWIKPHPPHIVCRIRISFLGACHKGTVWSMLSVHRRSTRPLLVHGQLFSTKSPESSGGNGILLGTAYCSANSEIILAVAKFNDHASDVIASPQPHFEPAHGLVIYLKYAIVNEQGGDRVWRIGQAGGRGDFIIHRFIPQPLGTGPRHMAILGDLPPARNRQPAYRTDHPALPQRHCYPEFLANATTVPDDVPASDTYAAAELLLSPTSLEYPHPYLYASNPGIGGTPDPRGDSIAIFDLISKPELTLVKQAFTRLIEIRGSLGYAR
ncbi:Isomerase YbhE [Mycena sanguinolenta]|uniref:Isomerase YbhE n=1 Tax=Mycena sanguinolenta TaxID=230812 RepID=A0A8H6X4M0_9AGAR|nr:Isomerase YbhE [Mycena sanguinolenta]